MIEKIKNLKWYFQLLMLVVVGGLMYAGVWYSVTSGTRAETEELNQQVSTLTAKNHAAEIAVEHINEFRALYASKAQEYDELKVLLPEQREITNVLQGLQDNARDSRMIVMRFSPRDDQQQESMTAKPVEVEVDSNFTNLRAFFVSMAKLPRIVSITDFKLNQLDKQTGPKTLHAQFLLTAYYATPENLMKAAAPAPGSPAGNCDAPRRDPSLVPAP
jgi:type IV pilus assembly protein PilO